MEHWEKIGKIAEENPDLTYEFIINILIAQQEVETGDLQEYKIIRQNYVTGLFK